MQTTLSETQSSDCGAATKARGAYVWCDGRTAIAQRAVDRATTMAEALVDVNDPQFTGRAITVDALQKKVGLMRGLACKPYWTRERDAILLKCIDGRTTQDEAFESANDAHFGQSMTVPAFKARIKVLKKRITQETGYLNDPEFALFDPVVPPPMLFKPVRRRVQHLFDADAPIVRTPVRRGGGYSMQGGGQ